MSDTLITTAEMKALAEKLNEVLNSEGWQEEINGYYYRKFYRNDSAYSFIQGLSNTNVLATNGKAITIPAGAYNSAITLGGSGAGIDYKFEAAVNLTISDKNATIDTGAGDDFITNSGSANTYSIGTDAGKCSITAFGSTDILSCADTVTPADSTVDSNTSLFFGNTEIILLGKTEGDTVKVKLGENETQVYTIGTGFSD